MATFDASVARRRKPDTSIQTPSPAHNRDVDSDDDTHDESVEIPDADAGPPLLLLLPVLVMALLVFWAAQTKLRVNPASYGVIEDTL